MIVNEREKIGKRSPILISDVEGIHFYFFISTARIV